MDEFKPDNQSKMILGKIHQIDRQGVHANPLLQSLN